MKKEVVERILKETKKNYNKIADDFSVTRIWPWNVMESFFDHLKSEDDVLDIGCGNGRLYQAIKDKNVNYLGIDNSEKLITIAQNKDNQDKFLVVDALNLPFEAEKFNVVFMMAILPHIPSKELQTKVLKNVYRVLKPDGRLFITCWNLWQPKIFWQNFKNRTKNKKLYQGLGWQDFLIPWKNSKGEITGQRFYYAFSKKELKKILEKAGFKIEQIYYEYKGEKSNWLKGFNLVVLAKK